MKLVLALALTLAVSSSVVAADLKFGVVDMSKAFTEFSKTKDAAEKIKKLKEDAQKDLNERYSVYKNLMSDAQKISKESQDPIVTSSVRAKKTAELQDKQKELRALEQEISEFQQRRTMQLKQEEVQLQRGLYDEIVTIVKDKAKATSYDFVFDKSGISMTSVPVLLYYKDATDFTDEVIVELNKNAAAAPKSVDSKDAPKAATEGGEAKSKKEK
jgi:outer membrane protein